MYVYMYIYIHTHRVAYISGHLTNSTYYLKKDCALTTSGSDRQVRGRAYMFAPKPSTSGRGFGSLGDSARRRPTEPFHDAQIAWVGCGCIHYDNFMKPF